MTADRLPYDNVAVAVPVTVPYVRHSIRGAHWFLARALAELLKASGLRKDLIDGLTVSSFTLAPDTAVGLTQQLGLSPRWLDHIPMGGASGIVALRRAARAVQCGDADVVACLAGDTNHVDSFRRNLESFSQFARDATYPYGAGGPNMIFALITAHYMRVTGATPEDFAKLCIAQRDSARQFPHALFREPLTLEQYLRARMIADPLRLYDCVMPCAGAEAFLVMRAATARRHGLKFARVLATIERHNGFADDPIALRGGWAIDRDALYAQAGAGPTDMDIIATYDDYPVMTMLQLEGLGLCGAGEAPDFVRRHTFTADGTCPLNTSGGQLSVGQGGAAGGFLGLVEAVRQLTGQTLGAKVRDPRLALVAGYGMVTYDRGVCSGAAVLGGG
jgi:acetyl-CoA acetyltransferase